MDINRGSRRARHVANSANTGADQNVPASSDGFNDAEGPGAPRRPQQRRRDQMQQQSITPDGNDQQHRTLDQGGAGRQSRAPPPNPFRLHRTNPGIQPRLSMPLDSDESSSEADISALEMVRNRGVNSFNQRTAAVTTTTDDYDTTEGEEPDEHQEVFGETEVTSVESMDEDDADETEPPPPLQDPATMGLKEISNLGKFTVSSHKQGNGVEELRSDDLKQYWQSDGPQPHKLTVYFVKRVGIREIRFYVDYTDDESYTPTKIVFKSGTSENNLIEFAIMNLESPVGWQQVPLEGAGGDPDGNTLVSWVLQVQILENHQNGKDTHLRGIKIYAFDGDLGAANHAGEGSVPARVTRKAHDPDATESEGQGESEEDEDEDAVAESQGALSETARLLAATRLDHPSGGFSIPDFMKEPEIR